MGWENIITIWVDSYIPFCNKIRIVIKHSVRKEKRKYTILNRIGQVIHSYIVFYNYEIDTDRWESIFSTEFIKLLQWKKLTNMMVIQVLQNGLGEHYYNSGTQLQLVW